ncbi:MAG: hypothetical protein RID07_18240, partial [Lacipirellulaceae bacterium]
DANADGTVDGDDFLIWQQNLGMSNSLAAASAVPEPRAFLLLIFSCSIAFLARERCAHQATLSA